MEMCHIPVIFHIHITSPISSHILHHWMSAVSSTELWVLICVSSVNWDEIRGELSVSNVIQRDGVLFAARLHPCLEDLATTNMREVSTGYHDVKSVLLLLLANQSFIHFFFNSIVCRNKIINKNHISENPHNIRFFFVYTYITLRLWF